MTMKLSYLSTYFDADEAFTVIAFLDHLRELLCIAYGEQIAASQREYQQCAARGQLDLDFGDWEPF